MKKYLILLLTCFALIGCSPKDDTVKGEFNKKGLLLEIDHEHRRILVEEVEGGLIWVTLPDTIDLVSFKEGNEVVVWIDGNIMESHPSQAKALQVELVEGDKSHSFYAEYKYKDATFPPIVKGVVIVDGIRHDMARGGFEWTKGNQSVLTDAASPEQIAESFKAIDVHSEDEITIEVEQTPNLNVYLWNEERKLVPFNNKQLTVPTDVGRYIYEVVAKWSNGRVSYTFVIEVE